MKAIAPAEPIQREMVVRKVMDPKTTRSFPHRNLESLESLEDHSEASKTDKSWHTNDASEKERTGQKDGSLDLLLKRIEGSPTLKEYEQHDPRSSAIERSQGVWCLDDCLAWDESDDNDDDDQ